MAFPEEHGAKAERVYCGSYMTSMEMAGVSLTVMKLDSLRKECLGKIFFFRCSSIGGKLCI